MGSSPSGASGGREAGTGRGATHGARTTPHEATRSETVEAPATGSGPSEISVREGTPRAEGGARSAQELAIEFLKAQEEALFAEPLPLSRREQVLKYFTALRQRLEALQDD